MKQLAFVILFVLTGCATRPFTHGDSEYKTLAVLWMQNAAEYRALSFQAYNVATDRLRELARGRRKSKLPMAVILDIDETVLDNSPYEVSNILGDKPYTSASWDEWVDKKSARALPGVVRFTEVATKLGIELFYVSNRRIKGLESTYQNMLDQKIVVKRENIFLRTTTDSKKDRRAEIMQNHEVVMLIGDNLIDFHESFEGLPSSSRSTFVDSYSQEFGRKLIIIPNPMYGAWLDAIYSGVENEGVRARLRTEHLYPIP